MYRTRLVICGSWHEFQNWLMQDEQHGKGAVYVEHYNDLLGRNREEVEIIKYGTWIENKKAIDAVEKWLHTKI